MPEAAAPTPPDRTRRAAILATVGIVVILGLAVFVTAYAASVFRTQEVVQAYAMDKLEWSEAITALGGPEQAVGKLSLYFRAMDWLPRKQGRPLPWDEAEAIRSLLVLCGEPSVPVFTRWLLSSREWWMRDVAAKNLFTLGPEAKDAVPALRQALKDTHPAVRVSVAWALTRIGPEAQAAVPDLEVALKDPNGDVRKAAAEALKKIRRETAPDAPAAPPAPGE